ncbi:response regulator [Bacterioplanoides sp.]|uniref:response regulator n=1 Tax=Bacterioplanoides sp. TaxID=2066072 RepID=UPI003B5C8D9B
MTACIARSIVNLLPLVLCSLVLHGFFPVAAVQAQPLLTNLSQAERDWLQQNPVIPIGIDGRWPPVDFVNEEGEVSGILKDHLDYLQQVLDVRFEAQRFSSFGEMAKAAQQGLIPLAATMVETPKRKQHLWFTQPYFAAMKVLVSNRNGEYFDSFSALADKTLAIEEGFYLVDIIEKNYPDVRIRIFPSTEKALIALSTGSVDAYIGNQAVVRWVMSNLQLNNLVVSGGTGMPLALQRFAVFKDPDWQPLVSIIDKALLSMPEKKRQMILSNWMALREHPANNTLFTLTELEQKYLQQFSSLTMGSDTNWPPFDFVDEEGKPKGLSAEYNELVSQLIHKPFVPVYHTTWQETLKAFKRGELDLISGVNPTVERREYMAFTKPYMVHPYMILVHSDTRFVNSFSDLNGKRVGVGASYAIEEILQRDQPDLELVPFASGEDALIALSAKEIDAYVGLLGTSSWTLETVGIRNVKVAAPTGYQYKQSIGVRKDKPELVEILNKAIDHIPDYKRQEIKNNWFKVEFEHQVNRAQVVEAVVITLVVIIPILIVILIWNRKLNQARERLQESQKRLAEAKDAAEQASQFKSQFLANMSHEIRTPMNAIVGMNHLLLRSGLNDRQQEYADKIKQSATALLGVINDILDFSKVEAGRLDIEHVPFNLHSVFTELSDMLALKAAEKGIEVLLDVEPGIAVNLVGDPLRLGQVLINLTQNAIKFTDQGEVVVTVRELSRKESQSELEFTVRDTGIGIAPDEMQRLFEPFTQADGSSTRKYGGTGLGLNISRQLVNLMGGQLNANSTPGEGSCFSFRLNFTTQGESHQNQFVPDSQLKGLKVLVIDDNPSARQLLREMLESFSFQVDTLAGGEEALFLLQQQELYDDPYGLVIADWQMPGINGIDTLCGIRQASLLHKPATVLITAYGREDVLASAENHQLDALLIKPINASILFDTIMRIFSERSSANNSQHDISEVWLQGNVLLVEDHEINQAVALEFLHSVGIIADTASNGVEAIEAIKHKDYDLVLMDLQMPVMDGLHATAIIRQDERYKDLPIVAMTAHAMEGDRERCLATGMNDHIAKPIDPDLFATMLQQWLEPATVRHSPASAEQALEASLENIDGIDLGWGIERVGGNRQLYFNLLKSFHQKHHKDDEAIKQALLQDDFDKALRLTHTLRGVAGNIGARLFEKDAAELEALLRYSRQEGQQVLAGILWQRFCESFMLVFVNLGRSELVKQRGDNENNSPALQQQSRPDNARQTLQTLERLLQAGDASAQHEVVAAQALLSHELANKLRELVDEFEFEQARQLVTDALQQLKE